VLDTEVRNGGAVGAVLSGGVVVRPLVSQGCRPVGSPATVTRADRNVIIELGGQTPLERIRDMFGAADPAERALMQQGLHIGRVIDEYKTEFRRGDFLIRSVMGADPESGAVAVGDYVEVGETVQFHVRDAGSADEDLKTMLATVAQPPAGALLFTCNGRGTYLFGVPDHDARAVQASFGRLPLAGLFCAGEIGPVGGRNFLHGFTASLALFTDA
jgi:small ligand-binding sensory domain FIST